MVRKLCLGLKKYNCHLIIILPQAVKIWADCIENCLRSFKILGKYLSWFMVSLWDFMSPNYVNRLMVALFKDLSNLCLNGIIY